MTQSFDSLFISSRVSSRTFRAIINQAEYNNNRAYDSDADKQKNKVAFIDLSWNRRLVITLSIGVAALFTSLSIDTGNTV